MTKLRIGVLGTGIINQDFHLPVLRNHPQAEVVAAANHRPESLQRLAADFNIPKTYTDFAAMAVDPDIDAVINGLPNHLHAPVTIQMLEAGKHVLCEKPMALNVAEGEQMIAAAERSGRKLMIAHMWRFDRETVWLRDLIANGRLGTIFKVKSHAIWLYDGPKPGSWFVTPEYAGGGALADMGIHSIDTLRHILGGARPVKVFAKTGTYFKDIPLDDTATVMLEFEGGVVGLIEAGWYHLYADGLEGYTQAYGTKGYARILPAELQTSIEGVWSVTKPDMPKRQQQCDLPMYQTQMDHFIDCILNDQEPSPNGPDVLWSMKILEAAYRSAKIGEAVTI
ncbi:MAG: Gfo/Idh/MocA family oxidoreductase [Anaerolineae bacterium]